MNMEGINRFLNDGSGTSAVEYGLLLALIAVAIIAAVTTLGQTVSDIFTNTANAVSGT